MVKLRYKREYNIIEIWVDDDARGWLPLDVSISVAELANTINNAIKD